MKKIWIVIVIAAVVLGIVGYNYVYQDHRDIASESEDFTISAVNLHEKFSTDYNTSEEKYLNKTIKITGQLSEINATDFTLNDAVNCSTTKQNLFSKKDLNKTITIKGRCIGYDDLLEQVKLDQCSISN